MKKTIAVLVSVVLWSAVGLSAGQNDPQEERRVAATMEIQAQATIKKDLATLEKVYHQDLMWTRSSGVEMAKADVLKDVAGPRNRDSIRFSETTIRIYGSVALFKGITEIRGGSGANMSEERLNILWVLLKDPRGPEGWQIVNRQTIALRAPAR